jgi:hypothetical protein
MMPVGIAGALLGSEIAVLAGGEEYTWLFTIAMSWVGGEALDKFSDTILGIMDKALSAVSSKQETDIKTHQEDNKREVEMRRQLEDKQFKELMEPPVFTEEGKADVEPVISVTPTMTPTSKWYSQFDPRYKTEKMTPSNLTIGQAGCYYTSLCNFYGKDPLTILPLAREKNVWNAQGMLSDSILVSILGGTKGERSTTYKGGKCIVKVGGSGGFATHFMLMIEPNTVIDPAQSNPIPRKLVENVLEYRYFM